MGDNVNITPGSGASIASDEIVIGGNTVQAQRVKIALGTDGNYQADLANGQATAANSVPVVIASDQDATKVDDAAFTAATSRVMPIGATYQATPDQVNDGDIGAPRMTIDRTLIYTPNVKILTVTSATPVPTGSDLNNNAGGALVSGDFQIRDTNYHQILIPLLDSGFSKICIEIYAAVAFDKAISFELRGSNSSAPNVTGTFTAGMTRFTIASANTSNNNAWSQNTWNTSSYMSNWCGLVLFYWAPSGAGAPTTGTFEFKITRAA